MGVFSKNDNPSQGAWESRKPFGIFLSGNVNES
jgi:hypothetical protein